MSRDDWLDNWFKEQYKQLDGRYGTMKAALEFIRDMQSPLILETGCQRQANDWGAGMSSMVFCDFLKRSENGGTLISVDVNPMIVDFCKTATKEWETFRTIVCSDSVKYLEVLPSSTIINLLYLDSWDYPIIEIADLYGPRKDYLKNYKMLAELGEGEVLSRHGEMIAPSQEHCLKEIQIALPHLELSSVVLIDDDDLSPKLVPFLG